MSFYSSSFGYAHPIKSYTIQGGLQGAVFSSTSRTALPRYGEGDLPNQMHVDQSIRNPGTSSSVSSYGDKVIVGCRHFSIGYCKLGENCPFRHDMGGAAAVHSVPSSLRAESDHRIPTKIRSCHFFSNGTCRKGASCLFLHDVVVDGSALEDSISAPQQSILQLCKFHNSIGQCKFGERCHFLHESQHSYDVQSIGDYLDPYHRIEEQHDLGGPALEESYGHEMQLSFDDTLEFDRKVNEIRRYVRDIATQQHQIESESKNLDLVIVMDCTSSMARWIKEAKDRVKDIIDQVKVSCKDSRVRVGFVAYRDFCDGDDLHCSHIPLTEDLEAVKQFIASQRATGGGDSPEDVAIGLQTALQLEWRAGARCMILVCDEPCHGMLYHDYGPTGDSELSKQYMLSSPDVSDLVRAIARLGIDFCVMEVHYTNTRKMVAAMSRAYQCAPLPSDKNKRQFRAIQMSQSASLSSNGASWFAPKLIEVATSSIAESISRSSSKIPSNSYLPLSRGKSFFQHTLSRKAFSELGGIQEVNNEEEDDDEEEGKDQAGGFDQVWYGSHLHPSGIIPYTTKDNLDFEAVTKRLRAEQAIRYTVYLRPGVHKDQGDFIGESLKFKIVKQNTSIKLDRSYFAEGAMRTAHGMYDMNIGKCGVAKVYKSAKKQAKLDIVQRDANSQAVAKLLAREYSMCCQDCSAERQRPTVDFVLASFYELLTVSPNDPFKYFAAEPFLDGEYKKYNSNNGWHCNAEADKFAAKVAESFSHFTFQYTQGNLMVVDCQGVGTIFTDPQIHSFSSGDKMNFGEGNRGKEGMAEFFLHHDCNEICKYLSLAKILRPGGHAKQQGIPPSNASVEHMHIADQDDSIELSCDLCGSICLRSEQQFTYLASNRRQIFCDSCQMNVKTLTQETTCLNPVCNAIFQFPYFWYANMGMEFPKYCDTCRKSRMLDDYS